MALHESISFIDSHTGGEPTRTVVDGGPQLSGSMEERRHQLREHHDWLRRAMILEPRGFDWLVGALLQPAQAPDATGGVIFFNNTGYIGMCGHGLIGVVETLRYQGRIAAGEHRFETPVGDVIARLLDDGEIEIENVPSYRYAKDVEIETEDHGRVSGDIAYGGNWFFLVRAPRLALADLNSLLAKTRDIKRTLGRDNITGAEGAEIDHIELIGPPENSTSAEGRSFVLCPGGQYDRSPCGTGLSAKLACLAADNQLAPGDLWRQESIVGSQFVGRYAPHASKQGAVRPTIRGRAHVTVEARCVIDETDPFKYGVR